MLPGACAEHRHALPLPAKLWHSTRPLLCRTSAPILCCVPVSPLPCPAFLSHPRLAFRALNLPRALLAVLGLAVRCRPSAPPRQRREERPGPGGSGRPLCCCRAPLPLDAPCPAPGSRAGKSLMSAGSLQRPAMEGRLFCALAALHPVPQVLGTSVPPRRHVVSGWQVEDVLPGRSCFFLCDAPAWQHEVAAPPSRASYAILLLTVAWSRAKRGALSLRGLMCASHTPGPSQC